MDNLNNINTTTWVSINSTATPCDVEGIPLAWGYACCGIAVVFFGSMFIPVKKYETGDGLFFN